MVEDSSLSFRMTKAVFCHVERERNIFKRSFFFLVLFLFFVLASMAQNTQHIIYLQQQESLLKELGHTILYAEEDSIRIKANEEFTALLEKCLQLPESFEYEFDSVPTLIKLKSEDKKIKIYNWNLPYKNGSYKYFGFVQTYNRKSKTYVVHKLIDKSDEINKPEMATLDNYKWWGCLYYKMVAKTYKGTTYYTLLGWDGNDITSNKKVIDVLTITNQGFLKFGAPIFEYTKEKKVKKRVIFEYNKQAVMTLRYESLIDQIVFDGLAPLENRFTGQYAFYGPDLSFDAFVFKNGKWVYIPEIDILKDDRFVAPKK